MEENLNNQEPKKPISPQEFAKKVKEQYPAYKDVDDIILAKKMIEKYPEYRDRVSFDVKKKVPSTSITQPQSLVSGPTTGSSDSVEFRLPTDQDFKEMQNRGEVAPPSEISKRKTPETESLYNMTSEGIPIKESKPKTTAVGKALTGLIDKSKSLLKTGFYTKGEQNIQNIEDIRAGEKEEIVAKESDKGINLITKKTPIKQVDTGITPSKIDELIEDNDLNMENPFLYYSTINKNTFNPETNETEPINDSFVYDKFNSDKLLEAGINIEDFDGFLNKKGYKQDFLNKETTGLFKSDGTHSAKLSEELEKARMLKLYISERNKRDTEKLALETEKQNIGKAINERTPLSTPASRFDSVKVQEYMDENLPILSGKLKEQDKKSKDIYNKHLKGDANLLYGIGGTVDKLGYGFIDSVNKIVSSGYDLIGADKASQEYRYLNEERQLERGNTRDVAYVDGFYTNYKGKNYIVNNDGRIVDKDLKIDVTDIVDNPQKIINKAQKDNIKDSVFSVQGSSMQLGNVMGDMVIQLALTKGAGGATGVATKAIPGLSKIPVSRSIGNAIIAQGAYGYTTASEDMYKKAIDAGINEKEAKILSNDYGQRIALMYMATAPVSPQTKAVEKLFGSEINSLTKNAISAYSNSGKQGFLKTVAEGVKKLGKTGVEFIEEGGKELIQETSQQVLETGINKEMNRVAGKDLLKDTMTGEDFINTAILSFVAGGAMGSLPSSKDRLRIVQTLSSNSNYESVIDELVETNGGKTGINKTNAEKLKKDVKAFRNQSEKIPSDIKPEIALDVMNNLEDISELEKDKKVLDSAFHEKLDAKIEEKRSEIKSKLSKKVVDEDAIEKLVSEEVTKEEVLLPEVKAEAEELKATPTEETKIDKLSELPISQTDEAIQRADIESDGGVRPRVEPMEEVRSEQQVEENVPVEELQPTIELQQTEGDVQEPEITSEIQITEKKESTPEVGFEKITKLNLPDLKKVDISNTIPLSENIEARVSTVEFMDGEKGYSVQIFSDGDLIEDKYGDTETEFSSDESDELIKFLESKKKGYALSKKGGKKPKSEIESIITPDTKRVSFNLFGVETFGTIQDNGSIIADDGAKYSKGMQSSGVITDVQPIDPDKDYYYESEPKAQGFFGGGSRKDSSLSKLGGIASRYFYKRKHNRLWNRLFRSNAGLDFKSGEIVRSLPRDLAYQQDLMGTDLGMFKKVLKAVNKTAKDSDNLRLKLLAVNNYMQGSGGQLNFLSQTEKDQLAYLRNRIDSLTEKLLTNYRDELTRLKGLDQTDSVKDNIENLENFIKTLEENKGKYINRSYQIFHDEKYREAMSLPYNQMPPEIKRRYDNAVDYLVREGEMTKENAESYISGYLDDFIRGEGEVGQGFAGRADAPFLKKRKDLPVQFQELLGVVRDPVENYLRTVDKLSRYIASVDYQNKMRDHLLTSGIGIQKPKQGYTKLTSDSKDWSALRDIYVPVEFKEAMEDIMPLEKINIPWLKAWIKYASMTKVGKTVLNPGGIVRNFLSGTLLGINSGHFAWMSPDKMATAFSQAFKTNKATQTTTELRKELIEQEIIGSGADSQEMLTFMNDFSTDVTRKLSTNPLIKGLEFMQKAYAFGDDFYKVSGYLTEKQRLIENGIPKEEASKMAGERIRGGYPTYSYLPKAFKELRRLPIIGTFISFTYEVPRSTKNNAIYTYEDFKAGRSKMGWQRVAGMITANILPSVLATYISVKKGIDDEDDDKIRDLLPDYQKDALLMYYGKDEKGYPKFMDLTPFAPSEVIVKPLRILLEERENRTPTKKVKKAIEDVLKPYFGVDLSFATANQLLTNNDEFDRKIYKSENFYEALADKNDFPKVLDFYLKKGGPGVYNNITDFMKANGIGDKEKFTIFGKEYTNSDALLGTLGIRTSTINYSDAIVNNNKRVKAELKDNKDFFKKEIGLTNKLSEERLNLTAENYIKGYDKAYEKAVQGVDVGYKLGLSKEDMAKIFSRSDYNKNDVIFLANGFQPPYEYITVEMAKNKLAEFRNKYEGKELEEIKSNYKSNITGFNKIIEEKNKELYKSNGEKYQRLYNAYGEQNPLK